MQRVYRSTHGCDDTHKSRCVTVSCACHMTNVMDFRPKDSSENRPTAVHTFSLQKHNSTIDWTEAKGAEMLTVERGKCVSKSKQ